LFRLCDNRSVEGIRTGWDLHVHSTRSDGRYSAAELIGILAENGIGRAAIVDHDTLWGYRDGIIPAKSAGIELIPGMEISTWYTPGRLEEIVEFDRHPNKNRGEEIHILWYGMDVDDAGVRAFEEEIRRMQNERAKKIVDGLLRQGYRLDFELMEAVSSPAPVGVPPMIMQMIERGYLPLVLEAIREFVLNNIGPGGAAYQPPALDMRVAAKRARDLGGVVVVAHPGKIKSADALSTLLSLASGIEAAYPIHTAEQTAQYINEGKDRGMFFTGGTDFHGYYESGYVRFEFPEGYERELERFAAACGHHTSA